MIDAADAYIELPEHVVTTVLDDEYMLLNIDSGSYFGLNGVASEIAEIVEESEHGTSRTTIVAKLHERYPQVGQEQLARDVASFCEAMVERGLFVVKGDAGLPK